jgi:hypothetical protein
LHLEDMQARRIDASWVFAFVLVAVLAANSLLTA